MGHDFKHDPQQRPKSEYFLIAYNQTDNFFRPKKESQQRNLLSTKQKLFLRYLQSYTYEQHSSKDVLTLEKKYIASLGDKR